MKKLLSAILILAMVLSLVPALSLRSQAAEASYAEFWVDPDTGNDTNEGTQAAPFKTITKAKEIVSTIAPAMTGDIIVHLGGGTYTLEDTINFTAADSGCNGYKIIYKAVNGETPLLSGGTLISNWTIHDVDQNIYVADVPEGLEDSRHFFVDGEYGTHAMTEEAPIDWKLQSAYGYLSPLVDSADSEEYVIMDLGEEKLIGQLVLYPYTEVVTPGVNYKAAAFPVDFTIETSVDGINYTVQKTVTGYEAPAMGAGQEFKLSPVNARYVKLNVTKLGEAPNNAGKYALGLGEFQVFVANKLDMNKVAPNVDFSTNLVDLTQKEDTVEYSENLLLGSGADRVECFGLFLADDEFVGEDMRKADSDAANLFDGDVDTLLSMNQYYMAWVNANRNLGVRIDLTTDGEPVKIGAVSMSGTTNSGCVNPTDFVIQLSPVAEPTEDDWVTVAEETGFTWDEQTYMFTFEETTAYKLRVLSWKLSWDTSMWVGAPYFYAFNYEIGEIGVHELVKKPGYNDDWNLLYGSGADRIECFGLFLADDEFVGQDMRKADSDAANLFDGDVDTLLSMNQYYMAWVNANRNLGVRIDLTTDGEPMELSAISMSGTTNSGCVNPTDFVIQLSPVAEPTEDDWVTVAEHTGFTWDEQTYVFTFEETTAYKLRVLSWKLSWDTSMWVGAPYFYAFNYEIGEIGAYNLPATTSAGNSGIFGKFESADDFAGSDFMAEDNSLNDLIDNDMETFVSTIDCDSDILIPGESSLGVMVNVAQDGAAATIGAVKIGARIGGINSPRDFRIQVATAAEPTADDWQTVATMEDYDWSDSDVATFIFDAVEAYKVRVLVDDLNWETDNGDGTYSGALQIAELGVYAATETVTLADDNLATGVINYGKFFSGTLLEQSWYEATTPMQNLIDGDVNTIVSEQTLVRDQTTVNGGGAAQGFRVDLAGDAPVIVDAIEISVGTVGAGNPITFEVQVTTEHDPRNLQDWVTVIREENFVWDEQTVVFPIQSIEAVQVRLLATEVSASGEETGASAECRLMIGEFSVKGHAAPEGDVVDFRTPVDCIYGNELVSSYCKVEVKNESSTAKWYKEFMVDNFATDTTSNSAYRIPQSYGMADWLCTDDIEIHYSYRWYQGIYALSPVMHDGTLVHISTELDGYNPNMPGWLEGAYEFINLPGEWYIHRAENKIYYKASGTMEGKTAVLGRLETLVNFDHCSNVTFDGVEFAHTTWAYPTEHGYHDTQSGFDYIGLEWQVQDNTAERRNPPAAIEMYYASNITITKSDIHNIGSHAIDIGEGSCNNEISNCLIYDVAGRAVGVGWLHAQDHECVFPEEHKVQDNVVSNNYITRIGLDYWDNSAIVVSLANGTIVEHNEVAYVPYTGITMGWGWNWWKTTCQGKNIVRYNHVHHAGQMVNDGGAIYALGNEVGSEIYGNYVHDYGDLSNDKNMALYLDNGSHHISLYENVVGKNVYWWGSMYASEINNCVWRDNYYLEGRFRDNGTDNTVENNTFMETGNISDYPEAQAIVDNAGVTDENMLARIPEGFGFKHNYKMKVYPRYAETYYIYVESLISATIPGQLGVTIYDWDAKEVTINMPKTADLTALVPEFTLADGYTCNVKAGTAIDFTNPLTLTVKGNGKTEKWTITVKTIELADKPIEGPLEGVEVTLDEAIANPGDWTIAPTQNADGSITFTQGNYYSTYIGGEDKGVFEKNTIFKFDILFNNLNQQSKDWTGFSFSADNTSTYKGNQYNVYFNNVTSNFMNNLELQKWTKDSADEEPLREMLIGSITDYPGKFGDMPNLYMTPGVRHSVVVGAVEVEEGGMRLFMYIDGNLVFNVIDDDNPHVDGGFFQIHPVTQKITLYPFSDIQNVYADMSELNKAIADAEAVDPDLYTEESYAALVEVLEVAKELRQDMYARQTLIDETAQALRDAIAALKTPVDYTALEEAIADAEAVDADDYTPSTYEALAEALEDAKAVLENADATQEEVDAVTEALLAALEALEETKVPDDSNGKTGDDSLIMAFALLMILSAAAICAIITLNKRMNIR